MKTKSIFFLISIWLCNACVLKDKKEQKVEVATSPALTQILLSKSIDSAIGVYDRRLDIKMKRKYYEPQKGVLVTIQKFFENGDTTKVIKLREEIIYNSTKQEVYQYHFIDQQLVEIHDFEYNKQCGTNGKQCMKEGKYFFDKGEFSSALCRNAEGTATHYPEIENANFERFNPDPKTLQARIDRMELINKKYASLPFPKPKS